MISNMNILKKLSFLIGVKMFVMAIFALWLLFSKYEDFDNAKKLENHIVLATYVSKTIHELQKERGLTAGFLGSNGEKFASNITEQRSVTTKNIDTLNEILSHNSYDTNVLNSINEALKNLQNIESIRTKVTNLSINTKDAIGYYTQINTLLLQSVVEISKSSDSKIISTKINGYSNFLLAKETIGIQRAIGTNILATQNPDDQTINKFISLMAMETSFLQNFQNYSDDTINQFFQKELLDSSIQKTATIQKEILEANYTTEPNVWFATVTSKIDKFKEMEDYLSDDITQAIIKEKKSAFHDLILMFVVGLIGWGFVFYITYIVTVDLTSKMKKFTVSLLEFFSFIKKEKENVTFIDIDSKDEFGVMAKVINENIQSTTIQLQEEKEFLDQVQKAIERLKNGQFNTTLSKTITSKSLELLRTKLNEMFDTLKILVSNDLNKVNDVLRSYSNKDFTQSIDDNGQIATMINELSEIINFMLLQNRDNGYLLQESSQTLLKNVAILNTSSNQSAASLEETAAAIEEITTTIYNNNEKIIQMNTISQSVTKSANNGEKLARDTNDAMDEINTQIHSINDAIAVIDQIAFQTNILSLNAAVEAATAGEAGKGFAVVAGEVRNLATRSAEAAKEIKILVESATSKANSGKKIADEMILGYENLNGNINQTIKLIGDISASSKEQQQGMEQINNAINSLDKQTQQNASIASQTHQIASKTLAQADQLVAKSNEMKFRG